MLSQNQVLHQGRYRIIHPFGNSDSAGLYEAYDTVSEAKVVLRERSGSLTSNITPGQMETLKITFAEQAKRLSDIKHDVLLGVRDFFSETGQQYLVLESFDGQDLNEFIGVDAAPGMSDVVRWADQLLDALEYLHSRSPEIIHQNINPRNIRLTSEFKIKLLLTATDGLDGVLEGGDSHEGSMNYKALEQLWLGLDYASQKVIANSLDERSEEILRSPADARTDLYGLAATLYHLLTRTMPADPLARIIDKLDGNDDPLVAPHAANPEIPIAISELLMKALEIKREDRFANATEMRDALKAMSLVVSPAGKTKDPEPKSSGTDEIKNQPLDLAADEKRLEEERLSSERKQQKFAQPEKLATPKAEVGRSAQKLPTAVEYKSAPKPSNSPKASTPKASPLEAIKLELAGDDLLDLPDNGPVVTAAPAPTATNVLSLDAKPVVVEKEFGSSLAATAKKGPFGNPILIVGAAAAVLLVMIGGWFMLGSSPAPQSSPQATVTMPAQTAALPSEPVQAATPLITETVTVSAQDSRSDVEKKTETDRKAEAEKKAKKAASADAKPTPEVKKKVTVDDLINDN